MNCTIVVHFRPVLVPSHIQLMTKPTFSILPDLVVSCSAQEGRNLSVALMSCMNSLLAILQKNKHLEQCRDANL